MTSNRELLARFTGQGSSNPLFLPDLTLWYEWHSKRGKLVAADSGKEKTLPQVAQSLGVPLWFPRKPWQIVYEGASVTTEEEGEQRTIRSVTPSGSLTARWILGPDGDWWQSEYPVKTAADLQIVLELVKARHYALVDSAELQDLQALREGLPVSELPRRPLSDLLHEFVGWSDGLLLMMDQPDLVQEILDTLDLKLQALVRQLCQRPGQLYWSPDNLDGQFISPAFFNAYLAGSYGQTTEVLHQHDKHLVVWVGGPIRRLLPLLAECGVDALEGISGPPQCDVSLSEARQIVGPNLTLWGGIPQDYLLEPHSQEQFEAVVRQAVREAGSDERMLLGITDRVPVNADLRRLQSIPSLIAS